MNLITTLEALKHARDQFKQILVTGQRNDYNLKSDQELYSLSTVSQFASAGKFTPQQRTRLLHNSPVRYVTNNRFVQIFGRFAKLYILERLEPTESEK